MPVQMKRPAADRLASMIAKKPAVQKAELSKANLEKHELDEKIKMFREGSISGSQMLEACTQKQQQAAWKRFEHGRNVTPDAKEQWESFKDMGRGDGKDAKKKMLLLAFLKEGKCGDHYFYETIQLFITREDEKAMQWVPWEKAKNHYGEEEAKARVTGGTLPVRRSRTDNKFFEFLIVSETRKLSAKQQKTLEASRNAKLSLPDYNAMSEAIGFQSFDLAAASDIMQPLSNSHTMSLKELRGEASGSGSEGALEDDLAAAIGGKKKEKPEGSSKSQAGGSWGACGCQSRQGGRQDIGEAGSADKLRREGHQRQADQQM